jgi:hypothetical protein
MHATSPSAEPHSTIGLPTATTAIADFATVLGSPIKTGQADLELLATLMFSNPGIVAPDEASTNTILTGETPMPSGHSNFEPRTTLAPIMHTSASMLNSEQFTIDGAYQLVIDNQTIVTGGYITIGANSLLSFDAAASYIVVNRTSTITLEHIAPYSVIRTTGDAKAKMDVTSVLGDITATLSNGQLSVINAITTTLPIEAD